VDHFIFALLGPFY